MSKNSLDILQDIELARQRNRGEYTSEDKLRALQIYAAKGSLQAVERDLSIPWKTVQSWTRQDWWRKNLPTVRDEADEMLDGQFTDIVNKAVKKLETRIEEGDVRVDKQGRQYTVPVGARDLSIIAGTIFDKRRLVRDKTSGKTTDETTLERMEEMFKKFTAKQLAEKQLNSIEGEVIDIEEVVKDNE